MQRGLAYGRGKRGGSGRGGARSGGGFRQKDFNDPGDDDDATPPISSSVAIFFQECSMTLDDHHDRHECLVKLSRDITIESKRIIFLLHRIVGNAQANKIIEEAESKLEYVRASLWKQIAIELDGRDPYRYLRAISPGIQEYVEAVTFLQYMQVQKLATWSQISSQLKFDISPQPEIANESSPIEDVASVVKTVCVDVPWTEYILGVADLSGELMRYCISCVGQGETNLATIACQFVRELHDAFVSLNTTTSSSSREINRKLWTLKQSLQKMEAACYAVQVRGSEVPKSLLAMACSMDPYDARNTGDFEEFY